METGLKPERIWLKKTLDVSPTQIRVGAQGLPALKNMQDEKEAESLLEDQREMSTHMKGARITSEE